MPEPLIIVNTSPLLYLHQVNYLELLQQLYSSITVPPAVPQELEVGKRQGVDVPTQGMWLTDKIIDDVLRLAGE